MQDAKNSEADAHASGLKKVLNVRDLTLMGVAAVIGAGIFLPLARPRLTAASGVILLFLLTAVTCGSSPPFVTRNLHPGCRYAGSAYTYSYVAFGEAGQPGSLGWALILEYSIGNIVVAISWSSYFNNVLEGHEHSLRSAWLVTDYHERQSSYAEDPAKALAWTTAPIVSGWRVIATFPLSSS